MTKCTATFKITGKNTGKMMALRWAAEIILLLAIPLGAAASEPGFAFKPLSSTDLQGLLHSEFHGMTVVNLWATWCGPCVAELPSLVQFADGQKVRLILLNADEPEDRPKAQDLLHKSGVSTTSYYLAQSPDKFMDPFVKNWNAVLPTTMLFDSRGVRKGFWIGKVNTTELKAKIDAESRSPGKKTATHSSTIKKGHL